jgi:predicted DNA-binding transcriptional regulator YafY
VKTDRLLSIVIYLLNRDLVSARELAGRFEVSLRTIQRDMETIELAGIPVVAVQGPHGGYGIMKNFTLDRQYVSPDDLFYIVTALHGIEASLPAGSVAGTLEKIRNLLPASVPESLKQREERLHIDYSAFSGSKHQQELFTELQKAIDNQQLVAFTYSNNRLERSCRLVEPMTLVFKWRSWYLYGFCRKREDYRIFRLGRIKELVLEPRHFRRREKSFAEFQQELSSWSGSLEVELTLKFAPRIRPVAEEFYHADQQEEQPDGSLIVKTVMPEDGWVYGLILSYGSYVEVLAPQHIREIIRKTAGEIITLYE